jgi:flagellin
MLAIKNNIMAANSARHLGMSYDALAKSVERLSSGLRINSAKDDAAGLAVRELMRADIAVLQQGARNALDGISMLQTMEGAMGTIDEALVRMKQLAEQASTGSYSEAQRTIMNNEFMEMADEINRIANATEFNGNTLLNSAGASVSIQFGTADTDAISITGCDMRSSALSLTSASATISNAASAQAALGTISSAITTKDTARAMFGYKMNRLESTISVINNQAENLSAAESRISDVDVATEMAAMTRTQVLAQAGVAMLAQANTMPQMALTLLR